MALHVRMYQGIIIRVAVIRAIIMVAVTVIVIVA